MLDICLFYISVNNYTILQKVEARG